MRGVCEGATQFLNLGKILRGSLSTGTIQNNAPPGHARGQRET
ncbi:MAG TPA: hypothetical protein VK563_01995 [Puia sp.]|nr:hypothetical protein [Puia sp.]